MGQKHQKPKKIFEIKKEINNNIKEEKLTKSSFKFLSIIGRGGFGKVWKVYSKKYYFVFARNFFPTKADCSIHQSFLTYNY